MAVYSPTSPYYNTAFTQFYLDLMINRPIPRLNDDLLVEINQTYQYRPDLLAFDLYQDATLWWVFYQRNPNTLQAPPLDFKAGVQIYLPQLATLREVLGF
jgi:hypothetical protein